MENQVLRVIINILLGKIELIFYQCILCQIISLTQHGTLAVRSISAETIYHTKNGQRTKLSNLYITIARRQTVL